MKHRFGCMVACSVAAAALFSLAPVARADVLVVYPGWKGCVDQRFRVGVSYDEATGGARRFDIRIFDPSGEMVWSREGKAEARGASWSYRPRRAGYYSISYRGKKWRSAYLLDVRECG